MKIKTLLYSILVFLAVLSIVALIMSFWLGVASSFRLVFGILYILFIPGLIWSYVFFSSADSTLISNADNTLIKNTDNKKVEGIDSIERIILSVALSLALVPLVIFFINKIGVKINLISVVLEVLGIILIGMTILVVKYFLDRKVVSRK